MISRARLLPVLFGGGVSAPTAPTGLTATPITSTRIDLAWTDNATDETGHKVYRSTNGVDYSLINTIAADLEAYSDTTVTGGTTYYYKVAAVNAGGESLSNADASNTLLLTLISWCTLNEESAGAGAVTRNDSHSMNHLTDTNTVTSTTGKQGNAANFVATSSEKLSIADNASVSLDGTDFTLAAWVNLTTVGANRPLINKETVSTNREMLLLYVHSLTRFKFDIYSGGATLIAGATADNLGVPATGTWYFIVAWHDRTADTVNIQVNNGTADSTATGGTEIPATNSIFYVGARAVETAQYHNGVIDEAGFWKRVLSADEKTALYNGGSGVGYATINP